MLYLLTLNSITDTADKNCFYFYFGAEPFVLYFGTYSEHVAACTVETETVKYSGLLYRQNPATYFDYYNRICCLWVVCHGHLIRLVIMHYD